MRVAEQSRAKQNRTELGIVKLSWMESIYLSIHLLVRLLSSYLSLSLFLSFLSPSPSIYLVILVWFGLVEFGLASKTVPFSQPSVLSHSLASQLASSSSSISAPDTRAHNGRPAWLAHHNSATAKPWARLLDFWAASFRSGRVFGLVRLLRLHWREAQCGHEMSKKCGPKLSSPAALQSLVWFEHTHTQDRHGSQNCKYTDTLSKVQSLG